MPDEDVCWSSHVRNVFFIHFRHHELFIYFEWFECSWTLVFAFIVDENCSQLEWERGRRKKNVLEQSSDLLRNFCWNVSTTKERKEKWRNCRDIYADVLQKDISLSKERKKNFCISTRGCLSTSHFAWYVNKLTNIRSIYNFERICREEICVVFHNGDGLP